MLSRKAHAVAGAAEPAVGQPSHDGGAVDSQADPAPCMVNGSQHWLAQSASRAARCWLRDSMEAVRGAPPSSAAADAQREDSPARPLHLSLPSPGLRTAAYIPNGKLQKCLDSAIFAASH